MRLQHLLAAVFFCFILTGTSCHQSPANSPNASEQEDSLENRESGASTEEDEKSKRSSPPAKAEGTLDGVNVTIDYSQPGVKGRTVWGEMVPYGKVWRTGANEATWIEFSDAVLVEGKELPAGRYSLFTIPGEEKWQVIFNSDWKQWGAYQYKESKDVLRVEVSPVTNTEVVERLVFTIDDAIHFAWERLSFSISVEKNS